MNNFRFDELKTEKDKIGPEGVELFCSQIGNYCYSRVDLNDANLNGSVLCVNLGDTVSYLDRTKPLKLTSF